MENNPLVQELDEYIAKNNLPPTEKLLLRLAKHNYVLGIQIKEDVMPMKKSPSLIHLFKTKPMATIGMVLSISFPLYIFFEILRNALGLETLIKALVP